MPNYIEQGPGTADKIMYVVLGIIMVAFLISLPFMVRDNNRIKAQNWHDNGCKMYDDYLMKDVPAKCQTYFVDHYQAQKARLQPPEAQ